MAFIDKSENINGVLLKHQTSPTNPTNSGFELMYTKSDRKLYLKNSAGTEIPISGDIGDILELLEQGSTPSNPGTGEWKLYFKSDGLYILDDTGTETGPLGEGGGGGFYSTIVHATSDPTAVTSGNIYTNGNASADITLTLPASPTEGDRIRVIRVYPADIYIDPNGGSIYSAYTGFFDNRAQMVSDGEFEFIYLATTEVTGWWVNDTHGDLANPDVSL